jgi:hypothetical protein
METGGKKNILNELKCIWMSTNFVREKLCNYNFDCDHCAFDKEMRKSKVPAELNDGIYIYSEQNLLEDVIDKLNSLKNLIYPSQYFINNCFIIKKFFGDTYFLGFNPILNVLLDNVTSTSLYGTGQIFKNRDQFVKIEGDWGSVDVMAPFDFLLESEVLPVTLKPQSGKWIGFIKSDLNNFEPMKISKEDFYRCIDSICYSLRKHIKKFVVVGTTMYDGGEKLKYIYQVIGKENYIRLLSLILS